MWKIILTLKDGQILELNDVRKGSPGWADCYPINIIKLSFSFEGVSAEGKKEVFEIVLSGMSEYNFFVEATHNILGGNAKIKAFWFMGKMPNSNRIVGFVIKEKVYELNTFEGHEYNDTATSGWKHGFLNGIPSIDLIRR